VAPAPPPESWQFCNMDQRQVDLVQQSFARASRLGPHIATTFYSELFAIEPSLRVMFKSDMIVQGQKLTNMLAYVVQGLDEPDRILKDVQELGARHVSYGVEAHHYPTVGTALMRTLRHELGAEFTAETRAAWIAAYEFISKTMCEAAYGPAPSRGP
jgi:methyl-accepting chemotaxis protein